MNQILLINVSGDDRPGLMALFGEILVSFEGQILDMGQAIIHQELALGLLVSIPSHQKIIEFEEAVFAQIKMDGLKLTVSSITSERYANWLKDSGKTRYILTLLSKKNNGEMIKAVSSLTHAHRLNIDTVRRLNDRDSLNLEEPRFCLEMRLRGSLRSPTDFHSDLLASSEGLNFDFSFQEDNVFRRNRRLVVFDMDSTLINVEVMDELAKSYGVGKEVSKITELAMLGEIDFQESYRRRVKLLRGMPIQVLDSILDKVELNPGAEKLIKALKYFGYKIAVISGGYQYVGEWLKTKIDIDYVYANSLEIKNGFATGEVEGEIVDGERKAILLKKIADNEGIPLQQTIAVGDGANDLHMLNTSGLGVAYHAKPSVKANSDHAISNFGLDAILYLIGFSDRDIDQALDN